MHASPALWTSTAISELIPAIAATTEMFSTTVDLSKLLSSPVSIPVQIGIVRPSLPQLSRLDRDESSYEPWLIEIALSPTSYIGLDLKNEDKTSTILPYDEIVLDRSHNALYGAAPRLNEDEDEVFVELYEDEIAGANMEPAEHRVLSDASQGHEIEPEFWTPEVQQPYQEIEFVGTDDVYGDDTVRGDYSWERDTYDILDSESGKVTRTNQSEPVQIRVPLLSTPESMDAEVDSTLLIDPRVYPPFRYEGNNFDELLEYSEDCTGENINEQQRAWSKAGADIADRLTNQEGVTDHGPDAEKFADFVVRHEFTDHPYARALNHAFLKWEHDGSQAAVPTADEILARAF